MPGGKTYKTAQALRTALEVRLLELAKRTGMDLQRLRRRVAFDRLLITAHRGVDDYIRNL